MAPLPVDILLGIYLGILTGIVPAVVAFALGFLFRYVTGVPIPAFAVVVLGVAIAGVNGGLLALIDPTIISSAAAPTLIPAVLVVLMVTIYAHDRGTALGERLPRRLSLRGIQRRTLSADVVRRVGGHGQVRVRVVGDVGDIEGYPPLPDEVRREIRDREWILDAAPLSQLEATVADRLRTEFDLVDVQIQIDERARATVRAAPPLSGLSKRVPSGKRAVSLETLVPTGLAHGDEVSVRAAESAVEGTVVSVQPTAAEPPTTPIPASDPVTDNAGADLIQAPSPAAGPVDRSGTAAGGEGRITVAVDQADARVLLAADEPGVVVRARGTRREFELVSLLRRIGLRFRKLVVGGGHFDETTLGELDLRDRFGIVILAIRRPDGWTVAPRGAAVVRDGDEVFAVGTTEALDRVAEAFA